MDDVLEGSIPSRVIDGEYLLYRELILWSIMKTFGLEEAIRSRGN